jgi:hypothetical protein
MPARKISLFVELCAGLASVSLMLEGGKYARPPVSRLGNKHGYALALLRIMGLRPGQGADRYLWCEPDPGCRALLHAYTDREVMQEAARIIRGWKDEEPRALWERLRAEGPIRVGDARESARWVTLAYVQQAGAPIRWTGERWEAEKGGSWGAVSCRWRVDGTKHEADKTEVCGTARRFETTPTLPATVTPDARAIEPAALPPGTVVYADFPYLGACVNGEPVKALTGYGNGLTLAEQCELVHRWDAAGAAVYVSECVSRCADYGGNFKWDVDITSQRVGQRRTFSTAEGRQEWVTCNRPPAWTPAEQQGLFG